MTDSAVETDAAEPESSSETAPVPAGEKSLLATDLPAADRGKTVIADAVVAKIAGIATREIGGVYDLGGATQRAVGKVRDVIPGSGTNPTRGIHVEVGARQAAIDVEIVADYGVAIHQLAAAIRRNIVAAIEQMTGLAVTEVNVTVHDIHFGSDEAPPTEPRVL